LSSSDPQLQHTIREVTNLPAGCAGDRQIASSTEPGTRQIIIARLFALLARGDGQQERARQLFVELGYLDEALHVLRGADSSAQRAAAAHTLGIVGGSLVTAHLVAALFDKAPEVQHAAAAALAQIGDSAVAVGPLKALLASENSCEMPARAEPHVEDHAAERAAAERARTEAEDHHREELELLHKAEAELRRANAELALRRTEVETARQHCEDQTRQFIEEQARIAEKEIARRVEAERMRDEAKERYRQEQERLREDEESWQRAVETVKLRCAEIETARKQVEEEARRLEEVHRPFAEAAQSLTPGKGHSADLPPWIIADLNSADPRQRAAGLHELARSNVKEAFDLIASFFDDVSPDVRNAAAHALCALEPHRQAEAFSRAVQEGSPERSRNIGNALNASGLAGKAIEDLNSDSQENSYNALCLLFVMAKTGEVQPLIRAIEEHKDVEVRRTAVKLLTLSGQAELAAAAAKRRLMVRPNRPAGETVNPV
jgi:HEAT repeat protein